MMFRIAPRIVPLEPRNPLVAPSLKRVAGSHRKSERAARGAEKLALRRELKKEEKDH